MKKPDKKALKSAGLITVIALVVFEAVALLVQLVDPEGGLLRVDLRNPVHHGILAAAALLLGVSAFLRERRKKESSYANNFEITDDQQMSSELYAVRQKKSSRHETYCILPQCV